jgi:membrane protein implicated in regulation of membrane protease activity
MRLTLQPILYFIAAGLFAVAGTISLLADGLGVKVVFGAALTVVMIWLGVQARKARR